MPKVKVKKDLSGARFGRLTVVEQGEDYIRPNGRRSPRWRCKCDCGNTKNVLQHNLVGGKTISCGCYTADRNKVSHSARTHGLSNSNLYSRWYGMKRRCEDERRASYKNYGGRGIRVCSEWDNDFASFYAWSMEHGYTKGLELDRIDNDKGYSPNNCRWVNCHVQGANQRMRSTNTTGYTGVYSSPSGKFAARITVDKVVIHLGYFRNKEKAVIARNEFIIDNGLSEYPLQKIIGEAYHD